MKPQLSVACVVPTADAKSSCVSPAAFRASRIARPKARRRRSISPFGSTATQHMHNHMANVQR